MANKSNNTKAYPLYVKNATWYENSTIYGWIVSVFLVSFGMPVFADINPRFTNGMSCNLCLTR